MLDALFFHTYYSYLQGDKENTQMYYELLQEEFNVRRNSTALNLSQLQELKAIREALKSGTLTKNAWVNESETPIVKDMGSGLKQTALIKKIHTEAIDSLKKCLGSTDALCLYNLEHPCGSHGRVDMVYMDDEIVYPTEIKPLEGKHDLVGQIEKYALYFRMHLHLKHFKRVQPVTICGGYDVHALTELKRMSVLTLKYSVHADRVSVCAL
jgi:hypothetical protein